MINDNKQINLLQLNARFTGRTWYDTILKNLDKISSADFEIWVNEQKGLQRANVNHDHIQDLLFKTYSAIVTYYLILAHQAKANTRVQHQQHLVVWPWHVKHHQPSPSVWSQRFRLPAWLSLLRSPSQQLWLHPLQACCSGASLGEEKGVWQFLCKIAQVNIIGVNCKWERPQYSGSCQIQ